MVETFKIKVTNESGNPKSILLFLDQPQVTGAPSENVFVNVYAASPILESPIGEVEFTMTREYFAVYGTNPTKVTKGVTITTKASKEVDIASNLKKGTSLALTTTGGQSPSPLWDAKGTTTTGALGSFQIRADDSFDVNNDNHIFIGLGARDPLDPQKIVPATTVIAEPSTDYSFYPHVSYYLATGSYKPGEIVDIVAIGSTHKVDFDKTPGIHTAKVKLNSKNQWITE